ncbi:MAG: alanine racemase, partial [Bacteroidales bacterium]|nr:alanine racemase [Bacteroidales bacterium]
STKMLILVKANGYGLGDVEIAKLTEEFGADYLGVAFPCEGIKLKKAGVRLPIIILTPGSDNFDELIKYNLEPSIINPQSANQMAEALKRAGLNEYPVHLKLDTGMQRVGFDIEMLSEIKDIIANNPSLKIKSIFSHLAAADEPQHDSFTREQIEIFCYMANEISSSLSYLPMRHTLNSSGIERFAYAQMDMVRLGIGLYGTSYVDETLLRPAASFVAPVIQVKSVTSGSVGYGRHGKVNDSVKKIATVQSGYADGVDRHLGRGKISFMVNGVLVPTLGNICMDTFMLDVTGADVEPGDEVTIFGNNPHPSHLAKRLNTISYEILTSVSTRIERVITD